MKKLIALFLLLVWLVIAPWSANAFQPAPWMIPSAAKTDDALIATGQCFVYGVMIHTDGTNSVTVQGFDNTATGGTSLWGDLIATTSVSNRTTALSLDPPIYCKNGIYIEITTGGTVTYVVYYWKP